MRTQEALQSRQKKINKEDKGTGGIEFAWHDVQSPDVNLQQHKERLLRMLA